MSAELLRRAAKTLREHAAKALPGPWHSLDHGDRLMAGASNDADDWRYIFGEPAEHGDSADYIALMHPPVAVALADLLEAHIPLFAGLVVPSTDDHEVFRLARAILREQP